jgi:hypothetical protein
MSSYRNRILAGLVVPLALALPAIAQEPAAKMPWIHVEVAEQGEKASNVKVNLPLSVAETALAMAPDQIIKGGQIRLSNKSISVADLRKLWDELQAAGNAQFVNIEEKNQTVTISREGPLVMIRINETSKAGKQQTVHVDVPVKVVDALLAGEGDELNIKNAMAALRTERGDIVRVHDSRSNVRIWINESSTQP